MNGRQQERRQISQEMIRAGLKVLRTSDYGSEIMFITDAEILRQVYLAMCSVSLPIDESNRVDDRKSDGPMP